MLFSSLTFIFVFLPIVWIILHLLKNATFKSHYKSAKIFLIISSLFFYAFWKVAYLPILLSSIIVNYTLARMILQNSKSQIGGGEIAIQILVRIYRHCEAVAKPQRSNPQRQLKKQIATNLLTQILAMTGFQIATNLLTQILAMTGFQIATILRIQNLAMTARKLGFIIVG